MLDAVAEDDDDGSAETVQMEQLGRSSSDKTLRKGFADGQSRAATADSVSDVLAAGQHRHGKSKEGPPNASTVQSTRTCLR